MNFTNITNINKSELLRLFYPMFAGYLVSLKCKMSKSGNNIRFRPPGYVFGIVWPILYILLGLSWINSEYKKDKIIDGLYFGLSTLLALWIVIYSCYKSKKGALFIMMLSILAIVFLMILVPKKSQLYLAPLEVWLLYALLMGITDIQNS
jgi:translocator protein